MLLSGRRFFDSISNALRESAEKGHEKDLLRCETSVRRPSQQLAQTGHVWHLSVVASKVPAEGGAPPRPTTAESKINQSSLDGSLLSRPSTTTETCVVPSQSLIKRYCTHASPTKVNSRITDPHPHYATTSNLTHDGGDDVKSLERIVHHHQRTMSARTA